MNFCRFELLLRVVLLVEPLDPLEREPDEDELLLLGEEYVLGLERVVELRPEDDREPDLVAEGLLFPDLVTLRDRGDVGVLLVPCELLVVLLVPVILLSPELLRLTVLTPVVLLLFEVPLPRVVIPFVLFALVIILFSPTPLSPKSLPLLPKLLLSFA